LLTQEIGPIQAPGAVEQARFISWLDGAKGDPNQALVSLGLVLHMLVVVINCLDFICCNLVVVIFVLLVPAK